ncbi:hypothetical protein B5X24_HaOG212034 [Helicoverpa armigera]|nr:hypothetical protein B5X24_HaOG212034 [Helicoverpa armigera]
MAHCAPQCRANGAAPSHVAQGAGGDPTGTSTTLQESGHFALHAPRSRKKQMNVPYSHYIRNMTLMIRNGFSAVTVNSQVLFGTMFGINIESSICESCYTIPTLTHMVMAHCTYTFVV